VISAVPVSVAAENLFARAYINEQGALVLEMTDGTAFEAPTSTTLSEPIEEQVGYDQVKVSPDRQLVGWVGLYQHCCTSYPIPRELSLYGNDHLLSKILGNDLPIWEWDFGPHHDEVILCQSTVHFSDGMWFIRQKTESESPDEDIFVEFNDPSSIPEWAKILECGFSR
jgi:hypothetical protein